MARVAEPKEIAEVILFLASDKSSFITGQTVLVKGNTNVLALPLGQVIEVGPTSPYLATAGSGDVLAGIPPG